jgi:hypothetical protein
VRVHVPADPRLAAQLDALVPFGEDGDEAVALRQTSEAGPKCLCLVLFEQQE